MRHRWICGEKNGKLHTLEITMKLTIQLVPRSPDGITTGQRRAGHIMQAIIHTGESLIVIDEIQLRLIKAAFDNFYVFIEQSK